MLETQFNPTNIYTVITMQDLYQN